MIVKIQPPNPHVENAVAYNEKKMNGINPEEEHGIDSSVEGIENGYILHMANVPEGSSMLEEFERLRINSIKKKKGPRIVNTTFHMSVNPSSTDKEFSDKEAVSFIGKIMDNLGYGEQPYRIYKHTDIPRTHYHVVATRVGKNGNKIKDSNEIYRLRDILKSLANEYEYSLVLSEEEQKREENKSEKVSEMVSGFKKTEPQPEAKPRKEKDKKETKASDKQKHIVRPFSRNDQRSVSEQVTEAIDDALKWNFSTFEQLRSMMLRRYNVLIDLEGGNDGRVVVSGADTKGNAITPPIPEENLGLDFLNRIREKIMSSNMSARRTQKDRIEKLADAAARVSDSYEDFVKLMEKKGVWVVVSWTKDGQPFGVTWLDRATRCAWKGSETKTDMKWLKKVAEQKRWTITKDRYAKTSESPTRRQGESRKETTIKVPKTTPPRPYTGGKSSPGGIRLPRINVPINQSRGSTASVLNNKDEHLKFEDEEEIKNKQQQY